MLREFSAGDRSSRELDVCDVKNDSPLDGFVKVAGSESFSPASSSSSSPRTSKQELVGNVEGHICSWAGRGVFKGEALEPDGNLMKKCAKGGCSINKVGSLEADLKLGKECSYGAKYVNKSHANVASFSKLGAEGLDRFGADCESCHAVSHQMSSKDDAVLVQHHKDFEAAQCVGGDVSVPGIVCDNALEPLGSQVANSFQPITDVRDAIETVGFDGCVSTQALDKVRAVDFVYANSVVDRELVPCSNKEHSWEARVDLANGKYEAGVGDREYLEEQHSFFPGT
ncbi:hypothetical protein V6N13_049533 [Hibiscus sabdariffa]|uniref:Uncharacterized protein n=1 Tax=Hibiscus sabdariffa TaxID=183260 RepID=A0ABR2QXF0_9ROSI